MDDKGKIISAPLMQNCLNVNCKYLKKKDEGLTRKNKEPMKCKECLKNIAENSRIMKSALYYKSFRITAISLIILICGLSHKPVSAQDKISPDNSAAKQESSCQNQRASCNQHEPIFSASYLYQCRRQTRRSVY